MHPMLNTAVKAARRAASIINRATFDLDQLVVTAKRQNDFVTEVDKAAEQAIIEVLLTAYPNHAVLAEESGASANLNDESEFVWIIDPLDGTTNFIHGFPQYAVSIALQQKGVVTQAVIYDPVHNDLFTASKGAGAFLNNKRLRVSRTDRLSQALVGTGFAARDKDPELLRQFLKMFEVMTMNCHGLRRPGAAALDLAYVAAGRYDGFFEKYLNIWDIAAGSLMITEAGGLVSDFSGEAAYLEKGNIIAGNPRVFAQMLHLLQSFA
ncbi:MAG: inositol monophosphatase [Oxalobacter formigenes]|nr:inositol monophosphatase [Oxalobacter formigenes]MCM1280972.1 inositol monophosphatase [Alistipes senegalensis]MCM1512109.1 inositol monophosphatase [Oxalobacter formigenes]